jgi:hypothetical protein
VPIGSVADPALGVRVAATWCIVIWMEPRAAAIAYWLQPLSPEVMPQLAAEWLAEGRDGPGLTRAACANTNDDPRDVRDVFEAALKELGVWRESREAAEIDLLRIAARELAEDEGALPRVRRAVCTAIDFDEVTYDGVPAPYHDLLTMCWLADPDAFDENGGWPRLRGAVRDVLATEEGSA